MLNAAVIGIGSMGKNHARIYSDLDNVKLVAVADSNKDALTAISKKYNVEGYSDYKELLGKEKIDLLSIAVPTEFHKQVAIEVIDKGINVLLEKPIAKTLDEAKEIIKKTKEKKVKLMIGHIERFNPAIIELKKRLSELGEIYKIAVDRVGPFPSRITDVGVVIDLSVHDIDVISYLIDSDPKEIHSMTDKRIHPLHEDSLSALIKYKNNITASLNIDWLSPTKKREITITGKNGMFKVNYLTQNLYFFENKGSGNEKEYGFLTVQEGNMIKIHIDKKEPLRSEIEAFIKSVIDNTKPPISGEDGKKALKYAQRILNSTN